MSPDMRDPVFEIAPRDVISAPVRRRWPAHGKAALLLLPAIVVAGAGLAAPFAWTVVTSFSAGRGPGNYPAVLADPAVGHAIADGVVWVLFALGVCAAGLLTAWPVRRARRPWRVAVAVLAVPVAVSSFAAAVAFRLLSGPWPGALGPGGIWAVLLLAFTWQWAGLAVAVFRSGLAAVPADLLRVVQAFGAGRARRARAVVVPALFPVGALTAIIVLVAAARVFELVLAAAPGSVQGQVDTVGVHFWRFRSLLGDGQSAALSVLYAFFVGLVALAGLWGLSREWPAGRSSAEPADSREDAASPIPAGKHSALSRTVRRWARWAAVAVVVAVWAVPLAVLVLTSLHDPAAAAAGRWWTGSWGFGSYEAAFADGQLQPALAATGVRAVAAALLLTAVAAPAAYALTWGGLPRAVSRTAVAIATVLAVLPPQAVAIPLGAGLDRFHLLGADAPLTGVYVAFGTPLAVLLLRGAFASVDPAVVRVARLAPGRGAALAVVVRRCLPALVAVAVLGFILVWNDLLIGLLFGGTAAGQAPLVLFEQTRQFAESAGQLAAGASLITVVPLIIVLATGRWLVRGLAEGVRR